MFYSLMLHSLLEKRAPLKIFGKSHFLEKCQNLVFLILVITNVINTIFYSPYFVMSFVILPFHTSSPQEFGGRKIPRKETKNPNKPPEVSFSCGKKTFFSPRSEIVGI